MTVLALLRHAKAVKQDPAGDHARALSREGRDAAERAGRRLSPSLPTGSLVIASDARRTRETAELAFPSWPNGRLRLDPSLYLAEPTTLLSVLRALSADVEAAVLVGHNPGLSELASFLVGTGAAADLARLAQGLATADAVVLRFAADWAGVTPGAGQVVAMLPREAAEG